MVQRLAFSLALRPGSEGAYDAAHASMSDELRSVYQEAGLTNWTMFRDGTDVVGYVESDGDVAAALDAVATHPMEVAFNDSLADVFVDETHPRYGVRILAEVWHGE